MPREAGPPIVAGRSVSSRIVTTTPEAVADWQERGRFLEIQGREIFVVERGPRGAPPVFVLHGFPGSSFEWRWVASELESQMRFVSFDMLGYGLSEKPLEARYSLYEQADLAERVALATGIESCTLATHDMGDSVGAELLMRQVEGRLPFSIDRSVVTNGSIFIEMAQLSAGQQALLAMPEEPLAEPLRMEGFGLGITALFSKEHPPSEEELDAMLWLIQNNGGSRLLPRIIRYIEERRREQQRWIEGLVRFEGPMTVAWGEQDPIAVVEMARRLGDMRAETEVIIWPDVGHWPPIEVPARVAAVIRG